MKTLLMYLENNGMLVDPKDVPDGLDPTFYIGLDRNFEIDIRTKINKEIKDIKDLERQLEEAREFKCPKCKEVLTPYIDEDEFYGDRLSWFCACEPRDLPIIENQLKEKEQ